MSIIPAFAHLNSSALAKNESSFLAKRFPIALSCDKSRDLATIRSIRDTTSALRTKPPLSVRVINVSFGSFGVTDYVLMTLRGLSSYACLGYSTKRLTECAKMAGRALEDDFLAHAA